MIVEGGLNFVKRPNLIEIDDEDADDKNLFEFLIKAKESLERVTLHRDSFESSQRKNNDGNSIKSLSETFESLTFVTNDSNSSFPPEKEPDVGLMKFFNSAKKNLPLKSEPSQSMTEEHVWKSTSPCNKRRSLSTSDLEALSESLVSWRSVTNNSNSPFPAEKEPDVGLMKFFNSAKKCLPLESEPSQSTSIEHVWKCTSPYNKRKSLSTSILDDIQNIQVSPKKNKSLSHVSLMLKEIEDYSSKKFLSNRSTCAKMLYDFFNEKIFKNELPQDMELLWCSKLTSTAGKTMALKTDGKYHSCKITLSSKILINFERLRDTLLHEMCHAAVFLISQMTGVGHGPLWLSWAARCKGVLVDIEVPQRCHNYEISYLFTYQCTHCSWKTGRQRRCVKLSEVVCPKCRSPLSLIRS